MNNTKITTIIIILIMLSLLLCMIIPIIGVKVHQNNIQKVLTENFSIIYLNGMEIEKDDLKNINLNDFSIDINEDIVYIRYYPR